MRFKRFCSLGVVAAIGMSILAGTAAAKETTAGLAFDFNQNDGGLRPFFRLSPTSREWRHFMSFAPAMRKFPLQRLERVFSSLATITAMTFLWGTSRS